MNLLIRCGLTAIVACSACGSPTDDRRDFKVTALAKVVHDTAGENVDLTLTLTNISDAPQSLTLGYNCLLTYIIERTDKTVVVPKDHTWVCGRSMSIVTLQAGESIAETSRVSSHSAALPPGDYRVYGGVGPSVSLRSEAAPLTIGE
jgi:archaellin